MTTKQEPSDSKIKGINKQLGQHLQHIVDHGRKLEKLDERLTKLEHIFETSGNKFKAINEKLAQHLAWLISQGRRVEKLENTARNTQSLPERLNRLEGRVSNLDYSTSKRLLDLDEKVGSNEKTLISNTGIAMAWAIFMTLALTGLFIWDMALAFSINDINARTVAHQVLPK